MRVTRLYRIRNSIRTIRKESTVNILPIIDINSRACVGIPSSSSQNQQHCRSSKSGDFNACSLQKAHSNTMNTARCRFAMRLSCFLHSHPSVGAFIPNNTICLIHSYTSYISNTKQIKSKINENRILIDINYWFVNC